MIQCIQTSKNLNMCCMCLGTRFRIQNTRPNIRTRTRCKRWDIRFRIRNTHLDNQNRSRCSHPGTPIRNRSIP